MTTVLVEITAAIDAVGTLKTFYIGSRAFQTKPTDTPANTNFISAMDDPGSLGVNVYGNGRTAGYGALEIGQLKLSNLGGQFDTWMTYGFDGRPIVIRLLDESVPYVNMPIIFTGTVDGPPELARQNLLLRLMDKQQTLVVPACPSFYGGTNVLPNGIDGVATDLKGKRKSRVYGTVLNISPDCVNTSLLTYQVNDGAVHDVPGVYDRGVALTQGANYATSALLNAATITAGTYATCFAEGLFRLNASPAGTITSDVVQGTTAADRTAAQIIRAIALAAGLSSLQISAADIAALDARQPAIVGTWLTADINARDAINEVAASIGAYAVFDITGMLRMGLLTSPTGVPILTLTESQGIVISRLAQRDGDLPISSVTLNHTKNWTVQPTDIAGAVTLVRRAFLAAEFRSAPAVDASVKLKYLLAPNFPVNTLIVDQANATGGPADLEAKRLLALYKVRRDMFEVTVHLDVIRSTQVPSLMSAIMLKAPRYNLAAGKLFWMIGFRLELKKSQITFILWG